jgi:hypothetical protein
MKTNLASTEQSHPNGNQYALRQAGGFWEVNLQGRHSRFRRELGALYAAYLLLEPPRQAIHPVALALKARETLGQAPNPSEALQQRAMGLEDAMSVRILWRRQRELERVLEDRLEIEPVKAEALRELEEVTERLRLSPWLSCHGAERCARGVGQAIRRFHARLEAAVDGKGRPDQVLRAFAWHLHQHLLAPSGRGGRCRRDQALAPPGFFIYVPPQGVVWNEGKGASSALPAPAAVDYLARFLCAGFALMLLVCGCVGPRPLKGGRAITAHKPQGAVEQTLVQGENPSQASKQTQETIKVRTYTVPAGSWIEQSSASAFHDPQFERNDLLSLSLSPSKGERVPKAGEGARQPSTLNFQPSTAFVLSSPMPVVERDETRTRTELGAAQKDTARELGAKLSSLKGIVWVGVGLFVFGLASLVYPPLKLAIGSVTTSAALMLGGVALMVLPTLVVGNELLILGGVALAVGGWFLAHRHGQLKGEVSSLKSKV